MFNGQPTDRRTVLKTMTAAAVGGGLLTGSATAAPGRSQGRRNIVEVVGKHDHDAGEHLMELGTHEIGSGWTTFEFDNRTTHTHFVYTTKIPQQAMIDAESEGMDLLDFWIETVTKPFQWLMDAVYVPGKDPDPTHNTDIYDSLFPQWFLQDATNYGGPGLTSGSRSSMSTVHLDPGKYIVECYVKDDNNDFHSTLGMLDLLSVTDEESDANEPESTLDLTLTNNNGLVADDTVRPGQHIVAVEFVNQQAYDNLLGHDVHLIRFENGTNVNDVKSWMNALDPSELISDGTEPGTFVGGVQDIWTGDLPRTGYFHVNLKPGDYAWVAEVPDPDSKGLLQTFTVPFGQQTGSR